MIDTPSSRASQTTVFLGFSYPQMYMNFGGWILFFEEKLKGAQTISCAPKRIPLVVEVIQLSSPCLIDSTPCTLVLTVLASTGWHASAYTPMSTPHLYQPGEAWASPWDWGASRARRVTSWNLPRSWHPAMSSSEMESSNCSLDCCSSKPLLFCFWPTHLVAGSKRWAGYMVSSDEGAMHHHLLSVTHHHQGQFAFARFQEEIWQGKGPDSAEIPCIAEDYNPINYSYWPAPSWCCCRRGQGIYSWNTRTCCWWQSRPQIHLEHGSDSCFLTCGAEGRKT